MLCARALERLRNEGYIILVNSCVGTGGVSVNLGPDDAYRQLLDALESSRGAEGWQHA